MVDYPKHMYLYLGHDDLFITYNPAVMSIPAWMGADIGEGPSIA
jgi:hypothetical protein